MNQKLTLYDIYQYNIWHLINIYKAEYLWMTIEEFKNKVIYYKDEGWTDQNQWTNKYRNYKIGLAKEILRNGMYLPFFGIYNGNNQLELRGGRHRLEALIKLNNLSPINQKFLIIIFPKQASDLVCNNHFIKTKLYFTFHSKLTEMTIDNMLISELIMKLEGFGSTVVLNPSLISFPPFNNELLFKKWITTPLDVNWLDIKKYIWTNYNK